MFRFACPLRWSDLDAQGHVNNAVIVDYLQEARVAFLRGGPASVLLDTGVVVVSHQVEYLRAIEYHDAPLTIFLGVSALGGARIELAYQVIQDEHLAVQARTVLCPFDFAAQRPMRLTPEHREFFAAHRIETEPLRTLSAPDLAGRGSAVSLPVRWTDLDSYGHVNNAMVYDYLQQARVTATTQWAPSMARAGAHGSQHTWLIARQDVDYVAQLRHRLEPYQVLVAPTTLGASSITLASEIIDEDTSTVFNRARTVLVCADEHGRKVPLPQQLRARLSEHLL